MRVDLRDVMMEASMTNPQQYRVLALRYATTGPGRRRHENFVGAVDMHDAPMPMDYFVWAIEGGGRTIVVDTGFGQDAARRRSRTLLHEPAALLADAGIDAEAVSDVILTHLHYDHAGGLAAFPNAVFHLQDAEMAYATGRHMCHDWLRAPFDEEDVVAAVKLVYRKRMRFHAGETNLLPGVSLHLVGGHSGGLQVVRVRTARGPLVIASDAFHFSENRRRRQPFPIVFSAGDMLEGHARCEELADHREDLLIPGHDPDVLRRWPRLRPDTPDIVRLDLPPSC
jgi:glyoxylase-like metal-dependent hydrolase (beta-lactamase superfamily II)